jgi:1-aminocyclopropane-1-carboxylate deaminase/D-cysteine desulfhydrase-like pyridoxal-dependent ACC family enzyme/2-polyprenyl-3-methyl-5-hydroxy-6-metoxy-1,4-benzoquinol methylase
MKNCERYKTKTSNPSYTKEELQKAIASFARVRLINLPTPLENCPRFYEALSSPRILIKRDDLSGLAFGGNNGRKLEFVLAEVKAKGADVVIYTGPSQSNEARQLVAAAAKVGIKPFFVSRRDAKSKKIQGNLLLDYLLGADIRFNYSFHQDIVEELAEHLRKEGHVPYIIGHHDKVLGTVAFVKLALELRDQLNEIGVNNGYIFLASDGATQSGLVLGFKILQADYKVIGLNPVRVIDHKVTTARIAQLANEAAKLLGSNIIVLPEEIENYDDYVGRGYGMVTKESLKAIELLAQTEGILLDPVYTGKAMVGLIDYIRKGKISADETAIFLHTGGTPALFAYNKELVHQLEYKQQIISRLKTYITVAHKVSKKEGIVSLFCKTARYFLSHFKLTKIFRDFFRTLFIPQTYAPENYWKSRAKEPGHRAVMFKNDIYNFYADNLQKETIDKYLDKYLKDVTGKRILDLGCGIGRTARYLAEGGAIVTGLDLKEMIDRAKKENFHPNVSYISGSMYEIDYPENSFDSIVSLGAISSCCNTEEKLKKVVSSCYKALKQGGIMICIDPFHKRILVRPARFSTTEIKKIFEKEEFKLMCRGGILFWPIRVFLTIENTPRSPKINKCLFSAGEKILRISPNMLSDYRILIFKKF